LLLKTYQQKLILKFKENASTNKGYDGDKSFLPLCFALENAMILNEEYSGSILKKSSLKIDTKILNKTKGEPVSFLFLSMLANSPMK